MPSGIIEVASHIIKLSGKLVNIIKVVKSCCITKIWEPITGIKDFLICFIETLKADTD